MQRLLLLREGLSLVLLRQHKWLPLWNENLWRRLLVLDEQWLLVLLLYEELLVLLVLHDNLRWLLLLLQLWRRLMGLLL